MSFFLVVEQLHYILQKVFEGFLEVLPHIPDEEFREGVVVFIGMAVFVLGQLERVHEDQMTLELQNQFF